MFLLRRLLGHATDKLPTEEALHEKAHIDYDHVAIVSEDEWGALQRR